MKQIPERKHYGLHIISALFLTLVLTFITLLLVFYHESLWAESWFFFLLMVASPLFLIILLYLLYFAVRYNKKHTLIPKKVPYLSFVLVGVVAVLITLTGRYFIKREYDTYYAFTSEKWQNLAQDERYRMIDSFIETTEVIGKPISNVTTLLGEPNEEWSSSVVYYLGFGRDFFAIDQYYYLVNFNTENIVTTHGVYQS